MNGKKKTRLLQYGSCLAVIFGMAAVYVLSRDFSGATLTERLILLCDAFTIPGVCLLCLGGLVFASREGAMDGLTYALSRAVQIFVPGTHDARTYADYVEEKRGKKQGSFAFLLICGGATLALAVVFLVLYLCLR